MPERARATRRGGKIAGQGPAVVGKAKKGARAEPGAAADRHTDENLDHGLEETFPASDPVSIWRGAD